MSAFTSSCSAILSSHLDEDTAAYIQSVLEDEDFDAEDGPEMVNGLIDGSCEDNAEEVKSLLWAAFATDDKAPAAAPVEQITRLLDSAVTMKSQDVSTNTHSIEPVDTDGNQVKVGSITAFFANQIGVRTEQAVSEKQRRKAAQKKLREDEERQVRYYASNRFVAGFHVKLQRTQTCISERTHISEAHPRSPSRCARRRSRTQ